jgi:NDP-sugar pyrophosphorylase family protein
MSREAIILAGGKGTRLRPYTAVFPKPLMPVGEKCILDIILEQLADYGFKKVTLAVNHQAELIKAFIGDGKKYGLKVSYSLETKALSTMGPLKLMKGLPENFLVMNGDILSDINYKKFFDEHVKNEDLFTISAFKREHRVDYGVLETNTQNVLTAFKEKPTESFLVSMGIYMLNKSVIKSIPANTVFGFDHLMYKLLAEKKKVKVKEHSGEWLDIGRPDDYSNALELFEKIKGVK